HRPPVPLSYPSTHPPTTDIYTLSLHDALPIWSSVSRNQPTFSETASQEKRKNRLDPTAIIASNNKVQPAWPKASDIICASNTPRDRKSTRLNSSHVSISYAVFCLKKKNQRQQQ